MNKKKMKKKSLFGISIDYATFNSLIFPMLKPLRSKAQGRKYFCKPLKPCHIVFYRKDLAEYPQMRTHMPGCPSYYYYHFFLHHSVMAKLAISTIIVK